MKRKAKEETGLVTLYIEGIDSSLACSFSIDAKENVAGVKRMMKEETGAMINCVLLQGESEISKALPDDATIGRLKKHREGIKLFCYYRSAIFERRIRGKPKEARAEQEKQSQSDKYRGLVSYEREDTIDEGAEPFTTFEIPKKVREWMTESLSICPWTSGAPCIDENGISPFLWRVGFEAGPVVLFVEFNKVSGLTIVGLCRGDVLHSFASGPAGDATIATLTLHADRRENSFLVRLYATAANGQSIQISQLDVLELTHGKFTDRDFAQLRWNVFAFDQREETNTRAGGRAPSAEVEASALGFRVEASALAFCMPKLPAPGTRSI